MFRKGMAETTKSLGVKRGTPEKDAESTETDKVKTFHNVEEW